ncbi:MAG: DUF433 domain-containing protein [Chloroflexales bacterium]
MPSLLSRITINPEICHGKPVIRGLRYPMGYNSNAYSLHEDR